LIVKRREIIEGSIIPRFYGIAYAEWNRRVFVCYPVPINLIVHWARELWFWVIGGRQTKRENVEILKHELSRSVQECINTRDELVLTKNKLSDLMDIIQRVTGKDYFDNQTSHNSAD
jgi:hypothetical protein